jgi:hypothetical protein
MYTEAVMVRNFLRLGEVCAELGGGLQTWHVRRLFERGLLPEPERLGTCRIVARADLPKIREALIEAGYLQVSEQALSA